VITKGAVVRLVVTAAVVVPLWLALRGPISLAVGGVATAAIRVIGERPVSPVPGDLGIVAAGKSGGPAYVVTLTRWHVNLIVLPILLAAFGRLTVGQRLRLAVIGVPILLILDGLNVFVYLHLEARRMRGMPLLTPAFDSGLQYGLAVFGVKVLPVAIWAALLASHVSRRGGTVPIASAETAPASRGPLPG
jgi:hypothetical protein